MKRVQWLDSCRFLAMFYIMFGHFIAAECPQVFRYWETPPSSWILSGFIGKLFLIFFFVILGFFASKPSRFAFKGLLNYSFQRYFQLAFYVFISTSVFIIGSYGVTWLFHHPHEEAFRVLSDGFQYNLIYLFRDSFLLEDNYGSAFWCIPHLILGSITCKCLSYIPQRIKLSYRLFISISLIVVLMTINCDVNLWVCITVLGSVLRLTLEWLDSRNFSMSPLCKTIILLVCLIIIKIPLEEGTLLFSLEAIVNYFVLLVLFYSPKAQTLLSTEPLPWLGRLSIGFFVVHPFVFTLINSSLYFLMLKFMNTSVALVLHFIISMFISFFASWILDWLYKLVKISFDKLLKFTKLSIISKQM